MLLQPDKGHLPVINALRGLAALMVAVHHFTGWGDGGLYAKESWIYQIGSHGHMGVNIFFVISGFVIPYSLLKSQYHIKDFFKFIVKRSIRIEIPYVVSIILAISILYMFDALYGWGFYFSKKRFILHLLYLIPFTKYEWYSIIYWTLAVEFQFYLLIALMISLFVHRNKIIQTMALLCFVGLNLFELIHLETAFIYSHTALFSIGIVTCLIYLKKINGLQAIIILAGAIFLMIKLKDVEMILFASGTAVIIYFVRIRTRLTNFLGIISYSLYLTHALAGNTFLFFVINIWKWKISPHLLFALTLMGSILLATLFWWLIERPSKKLASWISLGKKR